MALFLWWKELGPMKPYTSCSSRRACQLILRCKPGRQKEVEQGGLRGQPTAAKMGLAFTKLFARLFSKKEMRILMVSLRARCDAQFASARQAARACCRVKCLTALHPCA